MQGSTANRASRLCGVWWPNFALINDCLARHNQGAEIENYWVEWNSTSPQGAPRCKGALEDSDRKRCREQGDSSRSRRQRRKTLKKTTAFWDASALVPLCVHEAASRHAQSHLRRFAPAVWWGSLVEVHSAICRLHRDKKITDLDKHGASIASDVRPCASRCSEPSQDAPVAVLGKKLLTATTAYSASGAAVHGLMTVMPAARNGASSRVATLNRREAAMAAIWASATAIE
jgi:hypothetical protein